MGNMGISRKAAPTRKRSGPSSRIATRGFPERSVSGGLGTCFVAFPRCDAAAGRPGRYGQFSSLGRFSTTPGQAPNHLALAAMCFEFPLTQARTTHKHDTSTTQAPHTSTTRARHKHHTQARHKHDKHDTKAPGTTTQKQHTAHTSDHASCATHKHHTEAPHTGSTIQAPHTSTTHRHRTQAHHIEAPHQSTSHKQHHTQARHTGAPHKHHTRHTHHTQHSHWSNTATQQHRRTAAQHRNSRNFEKHSSTIAQHTKPHNHRTIKQPNEANPTRPNNKNTPKTRDSRTCDERGDEAAAFCGGVALRSTAAGGGGGGRATVEEGMSIQTAPAR